MIGKKFGEWEIIEEIHNPKSWLCKCKCGYERSFKTSYLNTKKATCCDYCKQEEKLKANKKICEKYLGSKHGTWTVLSYSGKNKHGSRQWLCKCICGKERIFPTSYLSGNGERSATTCKNCELQNSELNNRIFHVPNRFWNKFTNVALRRNKLIQITKDQANEVYLRQNKKCFYTNLDLYFTQFTTNFNRYTNASIDRIDSSKPYTLENIQWVHKKINMMKQKYSSDEFIAMCHLVAKNHQSSQNFIFGV